MVDLKIIIGEESYPLPQMITLDKFSGLNGMNLEGMEHNALICATLLSVSLKTISLADPTDLLWLKTALLQPLSNLEHASISGQISGYSLINFDKISIGEFADLDVLYTEGVMANIHPIVSLLYSNAPVEIIGDWDIRDVWSAVLMYSNFRQKIYKAYKNLFDLESGDGEVDEDAGPNDAKHAWYTLLMTLCADKFLDLAKVSKRPLIEALNYLAYMKQKNLRLKAQMEKNLKKSKLK